MSALRAVIVALGRLSAHLLTFTRPSWDETADYRRFRQALAGKQERRGKC